jgi:hypothetical protein
MLTPDNLHDYQKKAVNHQCSHPNTMLWLDMGLGKTAITLTSLVHLMNTNFLRGVFIVAPIRVIRLVWKQEALKWEHTKHLKFSILTGTRDQRTRALLRPADVYLINYENLGWLAETLQTYFINKHLPIPADGIVWDEVSKCKNSTTQRVRSTRKILGHFKWTTGLTGTPASNGYKDLHGQYLVVDKGQRLGTSKTAFKSRFYKKAGPYKEVPYDDTETIIKNLVGDITLEMSAADYNPLPDMIVNNVEVELSPVLRAMYDKMEKEFFLALDSGTEIEVFNQASLTNNCLQFSNGAMYPIPGMPLWEPIHDLKLDALEDILDEQQGNPVLCSYAYRSDAERIMKKFKSLDPINLTECKSERSLTEAMSRWKKGDCALMIGHPACLHPETEVLTELRGWVKIIHVRKDDRVHDGVEFVEHHGCSYSGFVNVIDVFGITMTPNHKLLIDRQWVEAKHVRDIRDVRNKAIFEWETTSCSVSQVPELSVSLRNDPAECGQEQQRGTKSLCSLYSRYLSQNDRQQNLVHLAGDEMESKGHNRQELRRTWHQCLQRVERFLSVLHGHVGRVLGWFDHRESGREQTILQGQLPMGNQHGAAVEQAQQQVRDVSRGEYPSCRTVPSIRIQQDDANHATQSRDDSGSGCGGLQEFSLRERKKSDRKAHVYDLVDCGPRNRFLIRNDKGEVFISHNSMGHGIDGLQDRGHTLVWFGLTWSLDLYEQFNARVRRQGQGVPVTCHRITTRDTFDQAQALALDEKAQTQSGLRNAIKEYRQLKGA